MMRYSRLYFADEEQFLYYEIRPDGYAQRCITVEKLSKEARVAADWAEWTELSGTGEDRWRYTAKFGAVATGRIEGEVPPPNYEEDISKDVFEEAWSAAREQLEARWASHGRHLYEIEAKNRRS